VTVSPKKLKRMLALEERRYNKARKEREEFDASSKKALLSEKRNLKRTLARTKKRLEKMPKPTDKGWEEMKKGSTEVLLEDQDAIENRLEQIEEELAKFD